MNIGDSNHIGTTFEMEQQVTATLACLHGAGIV